MRICSRSNINKLSNLGLETTFAFVVAPSKEGANVVTYLIRRCEAAPTASPKIYWLRDRSRIDSKSACDNDSKFGATLALGQNLQSYK